MARYVQDVVLNKPNDFVFFMMNDWLQKNSFKASTWKGESVYRRGDGFFEGFRYLKYSYANGVIHLEAWMKGPFGGEQGLTGAWGWAVKAGYKNSITQLITLLQQSIPQPVNPAPNADGTPSDAPVQNVIPVQTVNNTSSATLALIFGILSIVLCWTIFSIIFGCVSIISYRSGKGSTKAGMAKAGLICSIVGMCLYVVMLVLNILLTFMAVV